MGDDDRQHTAFDALKSFLVLTEKLDDVDATIYVLGLEKGIITTRDVVDSLSELRQSTAGTRLYRLTRRGFFTSTPAEGSTEGRKRGGRARLYRALHPKEVLGQLFEAFGSVQDLMGAIDEHYELLSETPPPEDAIWLVKPQPVAIHRGQAILEQANRAVRIYSHDCTWFQRDEIVESLNAAAERNVEVHVAATNPRERVLKLLGKRGIKAKHTELPAPAFCLVDNSLLLLPFKAGPLLSEYHLLETANRYLIRHFGQLFRQAWSRTTEGGKNNV